MQSDHACHAVSGIFQFFADIIVSVGHYDDFDPSGIVVYSKIGDRDLLFGKDPCDLFHDSRFVLSDADHIADSVVIVPKQINEGRKDVIVRNDAFQQSVFINDRKTADIVFS